MTSSRLLNILPVNPLIHPRHKDNINTERSNSRFENKTCTPHLVALIADSNSIPGWGLTITVFEQEGHSLSVIVTIHLQFICVKQTEAEHSQTYHTTTEPHPVPSSLRKATKNKILFSIHFLLKLSCNIIFLHYQPRPMTYGNTSQPEILKLFCVQLIGAAVQCHPMI